MRSLLVPGLLLALLAVQSPAIAAESDGAAATASTVVEPPVDAPSQAEEEDQKLLKGTDSTGGEKGDAITREDFEGLKTDIEVLREQWQRKLDKGTVQSTRNVRLTGNFQVRYGVAEAANGTFSIPQVQLGLKGNLSRDYEEGRNLDYSVGLTTDKGNFAIIPNDVLLSYQLLPSLDQEKPYLVITAGQQKKPFGLEATTGDDKKPTISGAQFASTLKLNERDIGVLINGDLFPSVDYGFKYRVPLFEYNFMVLNGNGPVGSSNTTGNNDNHLDLLGRVTLNAPVDYSSIFRGLTLGASIYDGSTSLSATRGSVTLKDKGRKRRYGADLSYVNTPIGFTLEYVRGEDPSLSVSTTNQKVAKQVDSEGYTFTLFYNFGEQFVKGYTQQDRYDDWWPATYQPFFRFDSFVADKDSTHIHKDVYTVGFNWFFAETTKLQINYNRINDYQASKVDRKDELLTQFQFGF